MNLPYRAPYRRNERPPWVGWMWIAGDGWQDVLWGDTYHEVLRRLVELLEGDLDRTCIVRRGVQPSDSSDNNTAALHYEEKPPTLAPKLLALLRDKGPATVPGLRHAFDCTRYTLYKTLHLLESAGLVRTNGKAKHPQNKRSTTLWEAVPLSDCLSMRRSASGWAPRVAC